MLLCGDILLLTHVKNKLLFDDGLYQCVGTVHLRFLLLVGVLERKQCYGPILRELEERFPNAEGDTGEKRRGKRNVELEEGDGDKPNITEGNSAAF